MKTEYEKIESFVTKDGSLIRELMHPAGLGRMTLGNQIFEVVVGDTVCILPGVSHCIENIGEDALKILCCCAPAYAHEDTELLE